jgi:hypothetical protein
VPHAFTFEINRLSVRFRQNDTKHWTILIKNRMLGVHGRADTGRGLWEITRANRERQMEGVAQSNSPVPSAAAIQS